MSSKLVFIEFDNAEVNSIVEVFSVGKINTFFPELVGEESAHEAMDAMRCLIDELGYEPLFIDEEMYFCPVSVRLTDSQIAELLKFCYRLTLEDVCAWGYQIEISKEVINAIWCLKEGLKRAARNIDQPLNW